MAVRRGHRGGGRDGDKGLLMDFGDVWFALGIDLAVLQGAVTHLYREDPRFHLIEDPGVYRLELVIPTIETRPACGPKPYRFGIHLLGNLFIGTSPNPLLFDAWVQLDVGTATDAVGMPVGTLSFVEVENVTPAFAKQPLADEFAPTGSIGSVLAGFRFDLFTSLLDSATRILAPPVDPDPDDDVEPPVDIDPSWFEVDFRLGRPAPIRRPVYTIRDGEPFLDLDLAEMTVPALVATVALAGTSPLLPGDVSIVRPGTGLQLVTTKAAFDAKLAVEAAATRAAGVEDLTLDQLDLTAVDGGIAVVGAGHKTGAHVTFEGTVLARYEGGTDGHLRMLPAVDTDVDVDDWLVVLGVVGFLVLPVITLVAAELFVWGPAAQAPGKVDHALQDKFTEPLLDVAEQVASGFGVGDVPAAAFLSDLWIFDGNLGVAVAAFLGSTTTSIAGVTYDEAHVVRDPAGTGRHRNRRRPVTSVATITLGTGQTLTPWQAAGLVRDRIVDIPGHHAVHQPLARGEWYLRSNPDHDPTDNLIR